ncbi:MAG: putative metal-dependent rane protease [Sphingomonas bacterium]|uniref:CPBP family intramembrane glutamic endopeptidase n=1 Tax=Sphingomonas bacterium TaxID=1895847 RepID=UPI002621977B|nr:type II CAAX endopeptidase family protein [Sphingomonas bacterium]MDB5705733.1 putative metal-dependent rane protease [Sphingomonas bacterium]
MEPIKPVTPPNNLFWRIVHFPPVLLVIGIAIIIGAGVLASLANHMIPHAGNGGLAVVAAIVYAAIFAIFYCGFVRLVERRPTVAEFAPAGWAKELGAGLLSGLILFSVVVGIIAAFGGYRVIGEHPASVLLPVLAISITSGVTEEIMLRGIFFRLIESWLGSWIALILSAALFGALHLGNPNATLLAGSAIALEAGVMLAALYMLTRRLWAAIGLHAAWNFTQGGIYGIAVSGFKQDGVLVPRVTGSDLLTGGSFGAEASLPAIIVCTAFGIALLVAAHRRDRFVKPFWARKVPVQSADLQE